MTVPRVVSASRLLHPDLFEVVTDSETIPPQTPYIRLLQRFVGAHPQLGYRLFRSSFDVIIEDELELELRHVYAIAQGERVVFTCTGLNFGDHHDHVTKTFCDRKDVTNVLLKSVGLPTNPSVTCRDLDEVSAYAATCAFTQALVVKPTEGRQGRDVYLGITDAQQLMQRAAQAFERWRLIQIEPMIRRRHDVRIHTLGGRVYAAMERVRACVVGDGQREVRELIEAKNGTKPPSERIRLDASSWALMKAAQVELSTVLAPGRILYLKETNNISQGGDIRLISSLHPTTVSMVERFAQLYTLPMLGFDVLMDDVSAPLDDGESVVLEVNGNPEWSFLDDRFIHDLLTLLMGDRDGA